MKTSIPAALAALSTMAAAALAQTSVELDPIVINSGGLIPIEAARYGRSASVLTSRDIEERGIRSVQDALRTIPGVAVNSGGGSFTQVRIRGGEANHTLILIDGVEAAGANSEYILTGLETANIDRIEVLRGPQSAIYGASASAGVINIITRKGTQGVQYGGTVELGAGWAASAYASVRDDRGGLSLTYAKREDEGWDYSGSGGEKDGIDRQTLNLSGDYEIAQGLTLGFSYRKSDERYDADGTSFAATSAAGYVVDNTTSSTTRDEKTMQLYADYVTPDGRFAGRLGYEKTETTQNAGFGPTINTTKAVNARLSYGLTGAVADGGHIVTLLLENEKQHSTSNAGYRPENDSIALEYRGDFGNGLNVQLGTRYDRNSSFGDSTTWNAAASYTFANGVRLHASAGAGAVNPSYFELFANATFGTTTYLGNPNLKPEQNESFDIGVEVPFADGRGVIDVTLFAENLTGEISTLQTSPTTVSYVNESGKSRRRGVEVSGTYDATDALSFRLGYTHLNATEAGGVEIRRPRHELALGATLSTFQGRGTIAADLRYVAGNYDNQNWTGGAQRAELPAFWTMNVAANYAVTDTVKVTARVENLFDEDYFETWGYYNRGRTIYVGLTSDF